ncbi:MAG: CTP-dependent riboflavin kinase [Candidatus Micrarchaeota archaeon]|nr:CTP-dependent riboflavin kinase [Candidatus Micrarchaeota archaeon]MDE1834762.1 CTP-dependent riboflavin kinase [Candidatus Micrarchaeota archaeon]MDE1859755.1 CTP-dependent riboflavin kinase [Candidatus Micrarchaeota archaeon]
MRKSITILGTVKQGKGEGRYYMSQKEYREQFIEKLGIDPYPGTLNLTLSESDAIMLEKIRERSIIVNGFKKDAKKFGDVICYKGEVSGIRCALIQPKLSTHINTAELIAKQMLREELGLKDGSEVRVVLE